MMDDPLAVYEPVVEPAPRASWMDRIDAGRWAFFGGLAGGVLILAAAFVTALFLTAMTLFARIPLGEGPQTPIFIALWGLATGGAVVFAALSLRERPDSSGLPGLAMVVAGLASFFALGGFIVGGLLAIGAGVLAMAASKGVWRVRAPRISRRELA